MPEQRRSPFPFQSYPGFPFVPNQQNPYQAPTPFQQQMPEQQQFSTPYQYLSKPQHPMEWFPEQQNATSSGYGNQMKGFMSYFQDKDGQMDLDKMLNTVGQVANTYQQITPVIKGIGSFMKGFK
ncbi:hypothetical protein Pryu01_02553 [Paraliobacillus ryukyuensis]|uniref:YppG-like protein n=1 Tax=Paraliobacillus ryukyuensis TaxID=200904 RepID=A0A366EE70_9BACI|nr:YppG family protein [Paraliobacillus ryukyuensis]RBO99708.1 YppG-like protein [Paraliobacillus ryukyuensis]